jgi:hypothetical protein
MPFVVSNVEIQLIMEQPTAKDVLVTAKKDIIKSL